MIDLYYAPTPNTWKVSIMLEECALAYRMIPVDIMAGDQKLPEFLAINPNGRIPAIVDHDAPGGPLPVFESGAILIYLAEKTGRFLAPTARARADALGWLMWQMGGLGPMAGQAHHYRRYAPVGNEYSADRFVSETARLYGVMDRQLAVERMAGGRGVQHRRHRLMGLGLVSPHARPEPGQLPCGRALVLRHVRAPGSAARQGAGPRQPARRDPGADARGLLRSKRPGTGGGLICQTGIAA